MVIRNAYRLDKGLEILKKHLTFFLIIYYNILRLGKGEKNKVWQK